MGSDDYRRDSGDNISARLTYLLIGGGIGAILALFSHRNPVRNYAATLPRRRARASTVRAKLLSNSAIAPASTTKQPANVLLNSTQASEKVGDVARTARETASRQTGTVAAAIDAGKKAYQEEKRKTELSGRMEAAPKYGENTN